MSQQSEEQLDVDRAAIKRCLIDAHRRRNTAEQEGAACVASYWNGYIRAMQHVLEMEGE
jgi:hypothetical protein